MKKPVILAGLFCIGIAWITINGCGSSSSPSSNSPSGPSGLCSNPSSQGLSAIGNTNAGGAINYFYSQAVTFAATETITNLSFYGEGPYGSGTTDQIIMALYNASGNYPTNLIYQTLPLDLTQNLAWTTASVPDILLPAGVYFICFEFSNAGGGYNSNTGGTSFFLTSSGGYGVFPDTFPSGGTSYARTLNVYATTCP